MSRSLRSSCLVALATFWASPAASRMVRLDRLHERGAVLRPPIIPSQFRGHWSEDLRACRTDPVDNSQVWITARSLNFYETNGHVVRITLGNTHHAVVMLKAEGEGILFDATKGLTLSPGGKSLTVRDQDDTGTTRFYRCPATTKPS